MTPLKETVGLTDSERQYKRMLETPIPRLVASMAIAYGAVSALFAEPIMWWFCPDAEVSGLK